MFIDVGRLGYCSNIFIRVTGRNAHGGRERDTRGLERRSKESMNHRSERTSRNIDDSLSFNVVIQRGASLSVRFPARTTIPCLRCQRGVSKASIRRSIRPRIDQHDSRNPFAGSFEPFVEFLSRLANLCSLQLFTPFETTSGIVRPTVRGQFVTMALSSTAIFEIATSAYFEIDWQFSRRLRALDELAGMLRRVSNEDRTLWTV